MKAHLRHLFTLGREHYTAQEYDKAEEYLSQVVQQHDGFADVYNMLGVIYHSQGRFGAAEKSFEKAMLINPNYTEAALNLSVTYNDRGEYKKARAVYERLHAHTESQPGRLDSFARGKIANMHADLGEVYASVAKYDDAVREYRRALLLAPEFIDVRTRLAGVFRDMGRHELALAEYETVKRTRADYTPARVALGVVYYALGRREEALAEWNDALDLDPSNKKASLYLRMASSATDAPVPGSALDGGGDITNK